jgi:hypothetical protein
MVEPNVVGHNTAKWLFDSTTMEMMSLAKDPASSTIGSLNTSDGTYVRYQVPVGRKFILLNYTAVSNQASGTGTSEIEIWTTPGSDNTAGGNQVSYFSLGNSGVSTNMQINQDCYIEFAAGQYITIDCITGQCSFNAVGMETTT